MIWERLLLRLVPLLLVLASGILAYTSSSSNRVVLAGTGFAISSLMTLAVIRFEREIRQSESQLRRRASQTPLGGSEGSGDEPERSAQWERASQAVRERANFDNVSVRDLSMRIASMAEASFVGASLRQCDLSESRLLGADFSLFVNANLKLAKMEAVEARRCNFGGADLGASNWAEAVVEESSFEMAHISGSQFSEARLEQCDLTKSDATSVDFSDALFKDCSLDFIQMQDANLRRAQIVDVDLGKVDLSGSILDRTSIAAWNGSHAALIAHLLRNIVRGNLNRWIVFDTPAGYVQVALEDDDQLRCEAVNFDSWTELRKSRKMTDDMVKRLEQLGFSLEPDMNFVSFSDIADDEAFDEAGRQLAAALEDVYGVSERASLEVTSSTFDDAAENAES
jgi:uncharacterized protein YjbI with pentapeptide repeats